MKNLFKTEQSGRSMVEMLGVLAIIGVLSVGGIAGYSKAMAKYKTTQTLDQLTMLVANIRTAFSSATSYENLNTANARDWGLASTDMYSTEAGKLVNPFMGEVRIGAATANGVANMGFFVQYSALSRDACVAIATAGWGEGFSGVSQGTKGSDPDAAPEKTATNGVLSFSEAATLCVPEADADDETSSVALYFY